MRVADVTLNSLLHFFFKTKTKNKNDRVKMVLIQSDYRSKFPHRTGKFSILTCHHIFESYRPYETNLVLILKGYLAIFDFEIRVFSGKFHKITGKIRVAEF